MPTTGFTVCGCMAPTPLPCLFLQRYSPIHSTDDTSSVGPRHANRSIQLGGYSLTTPRLMAIGANSRGATVCGILLQTTALGTAVAVCTQALHLSGTCARVRQKVFSWPSERRSREALLHFTKPLGREAAGEMEAFEGSAA